MKIRFLYRLSQRERYLIIGLFIILIVFIVYQFIITPVMRRREELLFKEKALVSEYRRLKEVAGDYIAYRDVYQSLKEKIIGKRDISVLTFIESTAQETGIRESIDYIRPGGVKREENIVKNFVEIKIDAVDVESFVKFLDRIEEQRPGLLVYSIHLKPFFKDRTKVDSIVKLVDIDVKE